LKAICRAHISAHAPRSGLLYIFTHPALSFSFLTNNLMKRIRFLKVFRPGHFSSENMNYFRIHYVSGQKANTEKFIFKKAQNCNCT
jgi:hypothetical protein